MFKPFHLISEIWKDLMSWFAHGYIWKRLIYHYWLCLITKTMVQNLHPMQNIFYCWCKLESGRQTKAVIIIKANWASYQGQNIRLHSFLFVFLSCVPLLLHIKKEDIKISPCAMTNFAQIDVVKASSPCHVLISNFNIESSWNSFVLSMYF